MVMGLFNRFKSNKNKHAEEFKKAYEANDMEKVNHVLVDWLDDSVILKLLRKIIVIHLA